MKPKGGECRNKLRKHLIFIVSEILLFLVTTSELVSTSPPLWDGMMPSGASPNRRKDAAATKLAHCYLKPRAGAQTAPRFRGKREHHIKRSFKN
ncbi:MAG: hypothetical protein HDT48_04180 [Ruminococcaceae bacterium]|nr:hypothetical protein [Oscillospiraceae bacterium]